MHLCVDARMYRASGIGTYLQNLLPAFADAFRLTLIGDPHELPALRALVEPTQIPIYSIAELLRFPSLVPPCDIFWSPHYNVPLLPVRARRRLVTIHDVFHLAYFGTLTLRQRVYARLVMTAAARLSDHIITVSEFSQSEIRKYLNVRPDKITVIPNAVDHTLFRVAEDTTSQRAVRDRYRLPAAYLLYVGNVKPHKNLATLVRAVARLPESLSHVHLVVVGKQEGFITADTELPTLISQHPSLEQRIRFTGFVAQADLPWLYRMAQLFVFPSYYEGFGLPPLEAMACGCPVITSDRASMPEICGDAAVYVDPDRADDIATKLTEALTGSASERQLRITQGQAQARKYQWETTIAHHVQLIRRLSC